MCVCVMDFPWEPVKCGSDTLFPRREETGIVAFTLSFSQALLMSFHQKKNQCVAQGGQCRVPWSLFEIKLGFK